MTMTSQQTEVKELLEEIKKWLIRGDIQLIKESLDYTPEYIGDVLRGKKFNEKIIKAAFDIALERKAKCITQFDRLKKIE
jgi:hypothetical protein